MTMDITAESAGLAGTQPQTALRSTQDAPVFEVANPNGSAPVLLLADHAGREVPASLNRLGLGDAPFERHIAYDIGVEVMTRRLADRLDAPALIYNYSRLLIDPNRSLDDPTSICAVSDGVIVPANRILTPEDAEARAAEFFHPYHRAIDDWLNRFAARGAAPSVISIHSFTEQFRGVERPWHVGILWGDEGGLSLPLIERLRQEPDLCIGDNEPYSGRNRHGYTVETHAYPRDLANTLIEVRQDLVDTEEKAEAWGDRLADCLEPLLSNGGYGDSGFTQDNNKAVNA
ncbi:MAG: N-formylglutamate amidohydrolase [Pseudomonadota bacterium]